MKVLVTGGTGAVGLHSVRALVRAGHKVTVLIRSPQKALPVLRLGATPTLGSIFNRESLQEQFRGQEAVVNLATAIPSSWRFMSSAAWQQNERVRTEGSAAIAQAASAAGVQRLVQESVSMLYCDQGAHWIDEDAPTDHYPMAQGNYAAEAQAQHFTECGGLGVILRFGWFYGPGSQQTPEFLALARLRVGLMLGAPEGYLSSIHLSDAGAAVAAALHAPAGTYNVVDDQPLNKRAYADALCAAVGTTPWLRLPGRLALLLGNRLTSLTRSIRVRNARFRTVTGWKPEYPDARTGLRATAQELRL